LFGVLGVGVVCVLGLDFMRTAAVARARYRFQSPRSLHHNAIPNRHRKQVVKGLAAGLDIRFDSPVASIHYGDAVTQLAFGVTTAGDAPDAKPIDAAAQPPPRVRVTTAAGDVIDASLVVVTVPLGVLKAGAVAFEPPLPPWKSAAVERLGFGDLNKVILQFESAFWDESLDYFGCPRPGGADGRGRCFCFWNLAR